MFLRVNDCRVVFSTENHLVHLKIKKDTQKTKQTEAEYNNLKKTHRTFPLLRLFFNSG